MQTKEEKPTPAAQCIGCTRNAPNLPRAHQEVGKQAWEEYQELLPGTPVWVQHSQNATWEPAVVVIQTDALNSHWIMQENGAQQPKVYRHTRSSLKIRSTPTDGMAKAQMKEWMP